MSAHPGIAVSGDGDLGFGVGVVVLDVNPDDADVVRGALMRISLAISGVFYSVSSSSSLLVEPNSTRVIALSMTSPTPGQ